MNVCPPEVLLSTGPLLWSHFLICPTPPDRRSAASRSRCTGQRSLPQPAAFGSAVQSFSSLLVEMPGRVVRRCQTASGARRAIFLARRGGTRSRRASVELSSCDLRSRPEQCGAFTLRSHSPPPPPPAEKLNWTTDVNKKRTHCHIYTHPHNHTPI